MEFNQLVGGRHPEAVRRILGEDIVLSGVSPELQAVITLENDPVENWYHQARVPWSVFRSVGALAANNSGAGILNPTNSNLLCVIDLYTPDVANQRGAVESPATILGATGGQAAVTVDDSRALIAPLPIVTVGFQRAAIPNTAWNSPVATEEVACRLILLPGAQVIVWAAAQNLAINISFRGYARRIKIEEIS